MHQIEPPAGPQIEPSNERMMSQLRRVCRVKKQHHTGCLYACLVVGQRSRPSDVYDISSLLVAELAFLHQQAGTLDAPRPAYYPGRKFPSDVYQRAGQLKSQLDELQGLVKTRPAWLRNGTTGK